MTCNLMVWTKYIFFIASTLNSGRHVLIMDEVDGMAGNEDRGGMQELINMIKITQLPIICMCNDRQAIKVSNLFCFHFLLCVK